MIINQTSAEDSMMSGKTEGIFVGYAILDAISNGMIKTASASSISSDAVLMAIKAFVAALESVSTTTNITADAVVELGKTAAIKSEIASKDITVKIASTAVKDSHYFMDVSLDPIKKADKSLVMVSFLMREGYLGRYMIKRCFYYLPSNIKEADSTYDELVRKSEGVKKRYLQGDMKPFDVMPQVKAFLDGVRGDFEFKDEDCLGTTVQRGREGYHTAEGPMQPHLA